jgi:hypothetical protein
LPAQRAELTASADSALTQADAFVDRLVEIPLAGWVAVGRSITNDRARLSVRRQACHRLDAILDQGALGLSAWGVRDAVETAGFLVSRSAPRWSRDERTMFAAAQVAAETAALALLARAYLSGGILRLLLSPFALL